MEQEAIAAIKARHLLDYIREAQVSHHHLSRNNGLAPQKGVSVEGSLSPSRKCYESNSPRICLCNSRGRLRQNYVIIIGNCRDLRLFHAELHGLVVSAEKMILREFFSFTRFVAMIIKKIIPRDRFAKVFFERAGTTFAHFSHWSLEQIFVDKDLADIWASSIMSKCKQRSTRGSREPSIWSQHRSGISLLNSQIALSRSCS